MCQIIDGPFSERNENVSLRLIRRINNLIWTDKLQINMRSLHE